MLVKVKDLTSLMDKELVYVKEAIINKDNFDKEVFEDYISKMKVKFENRLNKLKSISCNKKVIEKYENKINEVFNF